MKKVSHPSKVRAKREEKAYIDQNRYLGLCSYCKSAQNCTFIRDPSRPVCQCEEFEEITYASIRVPNRRKISPISSSKNLLTREDSLRPYKGLCSDCEERATCVYPKPEGGVWHCEEFR